MSLVRHALLRAVAPALAALVGVALPASAQEKVGLLVVAHGADSVWNNRVRETVAAVKWTHGPVRLAFLMGDEAATASWDVAAGALEQAGVSKIIAVPLMVSTFGSHVDQIRFYAGELPALPKELEAMAAHDSHGGHGGHGAARKLSVPVQTTRALDDAPELGAALVARWQELTPSDKKRPVMLIAHGPNDSAAALLWDRNIMRTASQLSAGIAPSPVRLGLLRDDAPAEVRAAAVRELRDTISALATRTADSVVVLPVLISTGSVNRVKIPADIAGLPVKYYPVGLAPHAALARWVERVAEARLKGEPSARGN